MNGLIYLIPLLYFVAITKGKDAKCSNSRYDVELRTSGTCELRPGSYFTIIFTHKIPGRRIDLGCKFTSKTKNVKGEAHFIGGEKHVLYKLFKGIVLKESSRTSMIKLSVRTGLGFRGGELKCEAITRELDFKMYPSREVKSDERGVGPHGTCDCGKRLHKHGAVSRIFFGVDVKTMRHPWMVALFRYGDSFNCAGSVITRWHVLTAAHCYHGDNDPKSISVLVATVHYKTGGTKLHVSELHIHSGYDQKIGMHDIAMLRLKKQIPSNLYMPICLPDRFRLHLNQYLTLIGWGVMAPNETHRDEKLLKAAHSRVVDPDICEKIQRGQQYQFYKKSQICYYSKHSAECFGDSGGPVMAYDDVMQRYVLVGITSFGDGCLMITPDIATNVHHYMAWIKSIVARGQSAQGVCNRSIL